MTFWFEAAETLVLDITADFSYGGNEYFWVAENDTVSHSEVRSFPEVRHQGNMATT